MDLEHITNLYKTKYIFRTIPELREGLRNKPKLAPDEIALFEFSDEAHRFFWNLGVDYKLKLYFFDADKKLNGTAILKPQQTQHVSSHYPAKYVIERALND